MSQVSKGVQELLKGGRSAITGNGSVCGKRARVGHRIPWPSILNYHLGHMNPVD